MRRGIRIASAVLAATLLGQGITPLVANAAEVKPGFDAQVVTEDKTNKTIQNVSVTGIEEAKVGDVLPQTASVVADNGLSWRIPVVWVDANGNVCKVAQKGVKAYPVFAFYIPKGYVIKSNSQNEINVKLPDFINNLFNGEKLVFINDPVSGVVYITGANGAGQNLSAEMVSTVSAHAKGSTASSAPAGGNSNSASPAQVKSPAGGNNNRVNSAPVKSLDGEKTNSTSTAPVKSQVGENTNSTSTAPVKSQVGENTNSTSSAPLNSKNNEVVKSDDYNDSPISEEELRLVTMHCDKKAIKELGFKKMAVLANLVRYTIQPQAVNALIDGFPSYKEGLSKGNLSDKIGFYIYYNDALEAYFNEDTKEYDFYKYNDLSNAVAYVENIPDTNGKKTYIDSKTGKEEEAAIFTGGIKSVVAVNINDLKDEFYKDEDGYWKLGDDARNNLDNTLVHEFMHGFMNDYTRCGMCDGVYDYSNKEVNFGYSNVMFPKWFVEGTATCVDNAYQYWNDSFKKYYGYDTKQPNETGKIYYSKDLFVESYNNDKNMMKLASSGEKDNSRSAYCSGYLACLYLANLVTENESYRQEYNIQGKAIEVDSETSNYSVNSEVLKTGLDIILKELHGHVSKDSMIINTTLDEIIQKVSPVDENGEPIYTSTDDFTEKFIVDDDKSACFCTDVLNYLEYNSDDDKTANGSLLLPFESCARTTLAGGDDETIAKAYVIQDNNDMNPVDYVKSTVHEGMAYLSAGKSSPIEDSEDTEEETTKEDTEEETTEEDTEEETTEEDTEEETTEEDTEEETTEEDTEEETTEEDTEEETTTDNQAEETVENAEDNYEEPVAMAAKPEN